MTTSSHGLQQSVSTGPQPALTPTPTETQRSELPDIKEWVAAVLALSIVGFTLWAMHGLFTADPTKSSANMSSILQAAIGLAGTVTGYYFGRIPAEKAAQQANQAAGQANAATQRARVDEARIRAQVSAVRQQFRTPVGGAATAPEASASTGEAMRRHIIEQLDQIG